MQLPPSNRSVRETRTSLQPPPTLPFHVSRKMATRFRGDWTGEGGGVEQVRRSRFRMGASSACHRGWSAIRARRECTTTVSATVTLRPLPCDKLAGGTIGSEGRARESGFHSGDTRSWERNRPIDRPRNDVERKIVADGDVSAWIVTWDKDGELSGFRISAALGPRREREKGRNSR